MKFELNFPHDTAALKKALRFILLMAAAFLAGNLTGRIVGHIKSRIEPASSRDILSPLSKAEGSWGLTFGGEGEQPDGDTSAEELREYDAYYVGKADEKTIYLTFDAGFDNGNLAPILDALKKNNVPATFFVVGTFVKSHPELVRRIAREGHAVGNHTYRHPDMSKITDKAAFRKELEGVEDAFYEATGRNIDRYYRPPQGKYSESNLKAAQELGYKTIFWSLAYVDWAEDSQPTKEEAFKKLLGRIHPGAIVLLHSTSKTNARILDELLAKWREMGYVFKPLSALK